MSRWACFAGRCGADWAGEARGGGQSGVSADWYGKMAAHITLPATGRSRAGNVARFSIYLQLNTIFLYLFHPSVPSEGEAAGGEPRSTLQASQWTARVGGGSGRQGGGVGSE